MEQLLALFSMWMNIPIFANVSIYVIKSIKNKSSSAPQSEFCGIFSGEQGQSKLSGKQLHYRGAPFHRIIKNFMIQGGDFTAGNQSTSSLK